jgi:hypothetical protein
MKAGTRQTMVYTRSVVLTAVTVFWDVILYSLAEVCQPFEQKLLCKPIVAKNGTDIVKRRTGVLS